MTKVLMRKSEVIIAIILLVSFVIGIFLYPEMPEKMASHWNAKGEVNGYMPKFWGLFLMPIISVAILSLLILIPKMDPLKKNIDKFRKYFDIFIVVIALFLFYLYILTLLWNLGKRFNMTLFLLPAFAVLFYCIGILTENAKQNWFIGIRTPWTLSNEKVWDKTHKLGGKLFKIVALITLVGAIVGKYTILFILIPIILVVIYLFVYSYFEYKKEIRKK